MMSELRDLYQEMILDHARNPRNAHAVDGADATADGHNPLCGDRLKVFVRTAKGRLAAIGFEASGCAISVASASMMTEALEGKTLEESEAVFQAFHELVAGKGGTDPPAPQLGKLVVFAGVREFPIRVKCATLAWHTLRAALSRRADTVSTE